MTQMEALVAETMVKESQNPELFSTFSQPLFCGNARIAVIVEILSGLQQLLENLSELFTIPWKTLRVSHITTKLFFILRLVFLFTIGLGILFTAVVGKLLTGVMGFLLDFYTNSEIL